MTGAGVLSVSVNKKITKTFYQNSFWEDEYKNIQHTELCRGQSYEHHNNSVDIYFCFQHIEHIHMSPSTVRHQNQLPRASRVMPLIWTANQTLLSTEEEAGTFCKTMKALCCRPKGSRHIIKYP